MLSTGSEQQGQNIRVRTVFLTLTKNLGFTCIISSGMQETVNMSKNGSFFHRSSQSVGPVTSNAEVKTVSNGNERNIDFNSWKFIRSSIQLESQTTSMSPVYNTCGVTWKDISRFTDWVMFCASNLYFIIVFVVFALVIVFRNKHTHTRTHARTHARTHIYIPTIDHDLVLIALL